MNKYKLINTKTKEEHLCDKVTVAGFDYYVSDEDVISPCYFYNKSTNYLGKALRKEGNFWVCENIEGFHLLSKAKKVIATNNPNIDIPKVVDKIERLADLKYPNENTKNIQLTSDINLRKACFKSGYNKSQETHLFSEEDMIEFKIWCDNNTGHNWTNLRYKSTKELLQLWKEQQPKIVYYESK